MGLSTVSHFWHQVWPNTDGFWTHDDTMSVAVGPFNLPIIWIRSRVLQCQTSFYDSQSVSNVCHFLGGGWVLQFGVLAPSLTQHWLFLDSWWYHVCCLFCAIGPFNLPIMDPSKGAAVSNQLLVANLCQTCATFWDVVEYYSLAYWHQVWPNTDGFWTHDDTMSVAVWPFNLPIIDPIKGVAVSNQLLIANLCQTCVTFALEGAWVQYGILALSLTQHWWFLDSWWHHVCCCWTSW
jgi:hypothetical protein